MAHQELKTYNLHDLWVMNMVSVFPMSKTAFLIISKNRPISSDFDFDFIISINRFFYLSNFQQIWHRYTLVPINQTQIN